MTDFTLTPAGPDAMTLEQIEAMKVRISDLAMRRKRRRPTLEAWSFRIETGLHHDLNRLSKQMKDASMSDIVHGLLEIWVPLLLRGQGTGVREGIAPDQRQQLATLLTALVQTLQQPAP